MHFGKTGRNRAVIIELSSKFSLTLIKGNIYNLVDVYSQLNFSFYLKNRKEKLDIMINDVL